MGRLEPASKCRAPPVQVSRSMDIENIQEILSQLILKKEEVVNFAGRQHIQTYGDGATCGLDPPLLLHCQTSSLTKAN